jgi:hypothetical protein
MILFPQSKRVFLTVALIVDLLPSCLARPPAPSFSSFLLSSLVAAASSSTDVVATRDRSLFLLHLLLLLPASSFRLYCILLAPFPPPFPPPSPQFITDNRVTIPSFRPRYISRDNPHVRVPPARLPQIARREGGYCTSGGSAAVERSRQHRPLQSPKQ